MAIAYIANSVATASDLVTTDTTINISLGAVIPTGSTIVVAAVFSAGVLSHITSVTDDAGNKYSQRLFRSAAAGSQTAEMWTTEASGSVGAPTIVTINYLTGNTMSAAVLAYSGVVSFGKNVISNGPGANPSSSLTTQDANNWLVGMLWTGAAASGFVANAGNLRGSTFNSGDVAISVGDNTSVAPGSATYSNTVTSEPWFSAGLELRTVAAVSVINYSVLTANGNRSAGITSTTASITPSANALVLIAVRNSVASGTPPTPTVSGNGLTYDQIATELYSTVATPQRRITLFRAMGAAPTAGAITITFAASQTNSDWIVAQFTNVDTTGMNGAGAIVQSALNAGDSSAITVTLGAFASTRNAAYGVFARTAQAPSPGTGFSSVICYSGSSAFTGLAGIIADNTTAVVSANAGASSQDMGGIAVEIAAAPLPRTSQRVGIFSKDAVLSCGTFDMGVPNALYGWYDDDFVAQFSGTAVGVTATGIASVPPGVFSKDATLDGLFDD